MPDTAKAPASPLEVDVLCVGHACFDLVFAVERHPAADEKGLATAFHSCGGGPAANAAVAAARLGCRSALAAYLGQDIFGTRHFRELTEAGVQTRLLVRGRRPTPLTVVLVKPDGKRALVNYRGDTKPLRPEQVDFTACRPRVVLLDGHEPAISLPLVAALRRRGVPTVLDAGSVHDGTLALADQVDYLVASEKFARDFTGRTDPEQAVRRLSRRDTAAVITLGECGLVWKKGAEQGRVPAFAVEAVDTTGAGDAFHGAFAAGLALDRPWAALLRFASAAGALCCTRFGARHGIPSALELNRFLAMRPVEAGATGDRQDPAGKI